MRTKIGTDKLPDTVMNGMEAVYRRKDRHWRLTSPVSSAASVCSAPQATLMTLESCAQSRQIRLRSISQGRSIA